MRRVLVTVNLLGRHLELDGGESMNVWIARFDAGDRDPGPLSVAAVQDVFDIARDATIENRMVDAHGILETLEDVLGLVMEPARAQALRAFLERHESEIRILSATEHVESTADLI